MSIGWWYGTATTALLWALYLFLGRTADLTALLSTPDVGLGLRGLLFALWFLLPIFLALDWRSIRDDAAWDPGIGPWLLVSVVWLANIAAATAYCIRRESALRNTVPSARWAYGIVVGIVFWVALVGVNLLSTVVSTGVISTVFSGPVILLALSGLPTCLYLDAEHVRGHTHWNPSVRFWLAGASVPLVNVLVGAAYLLRRRAEFAETSDPDSVALLGVDEEPIPPVPSPWFDRVAAALGLYFFAFVILGGTPGLLSVGLGGLAAVLWVPFGLAVTPMIRYDLKALTAAGAAWGWTRYLYLSSFLLPPVAFLYLLRRTTVVHDVLRRTGPTQARAEPEFPNPDRLDPNGSND
ncbi:hypothetical protein [Halopelagius fulvigenes]|uniref:Uncharacterized protein n=1 Tax=Halopelagius fulvigenes TaxID=1198324 RepID=A0ABD5TWI6_9EURY